MKVLVTLDTNVLDHSEVSKIEQAVQGLPIELTHTSVTVRELEGTDFTLLGQPITETVVWDESRWDQGLWGDASTENLFEAILRTMSEGAFPRNRSNLSAGHRRQMRDAMILTAHARSGGNIFVTKETHAFGAKDSSRRKQLEQLCSTQIMNLSDFYLYCQTLKKDNEESIQKEQVKGMNEQQQRQAPKHKLSLQNYATILRFWLQLFRARHDPKAFEQTVENLARDAGIPPKDIPVVRNSFIAVRDVAQTNQSSFVDLYLVGGIGAIDLILLPVLLTAGTSDTPLSVALHLLVLSLLLTAMSLFFSFLKQKYNITTYGRVHSSLSFFALVTGSASLDGAIWHVSRIDGIVFLCLAVAMYLWALFYLVLIQAALRFISLQKPPEAEKPDAPPSTIG